jgi:hypothetical protein
MSVTASLPAEVTPEQLRAVASLLMAIAGAQWELLARSFRRMTDAGAVISPDMAAVLDQLADRLRQASRERAELVAADDLLGP